MRWVAKLFEILAVVFIALMVVTVSIQVFSRFLGHPIIWSEELTRVFLIYGSFMGGALAYYKGRGFKITILVDALPLKLKKIVEVVIVIISILLLTFVLYSIYLYIGNTGSSKTPLLGITHTMVLISMPIGYGLIIIRLINDLRNTLTNNKVEENKV